MNIMESVFDKIDRQKQSFLGITPAAVIWNVTNWRKYFAFCVGLASLSWIVFGFDSCWSQLKPFIDYFTIIFINNPIGELQTGIPFTQMWEDSKFYYGMGNHFSAPVIYGSAFIVLSLYLEKIGIKKSLNFCATTALSLMSIGIFEIMWNSAYAHFHGQVWVITFKWKQAANLCAFIVFVAIGLLVFFYLGLEGYRPNLSKLSLSLFALTVICWGVWINYPLAVGHITVDTTAGPWTNSNMFPQTYYCVDVAPDDKIAIGEPNWVQNDMVHFVNTFTKVVQTAFVLNICMVKKIIGEKRNE